MEMENELEVARGESPTPLPQLLKLHPRAAPLSQVARPPQSEVGVDVTSMRLEDTAGMHAASSFAAEAAAGVLGALRVVMECSAATGGKRVIHHWCDDEGVVKVASSSPEASRYYREQRARRHIFAELEARVPQWRKAGGT